MKYQVLQYFMSSYFLLVKISLFRSLFWNYPLFHRADVQCPLVIDHGRIPTTCRRLTGDVCEFTCNEGYQLGVPETTMLLCESNGKWNQTSELCKGRALVSIGIIEYLFKILLALFDVIAGSLKIKTQKHGIVNFKLPAFFIQTNFYKSTFTHLYIWDAVFTGILMILIVNSALSYSTKKECSLILPIYHLSTS